MFHYFKIIFYNKNWQFGNFKNLSLVDSLKNFGTVVSKNIAFTPKQLLFTNINDLNS